VGDGERDEDDEGVGEVERRDGQQQPESVEREEGPEIEARYPVPPPQQVHALHRLAVHLEPRHADAVAARIGERCRAGGVRSGLDADREREDGRRVWVGFTGLTRRDTIGGGSSRLWAASVASRGPPPRGFFSPVLSRCGVPLRGSSSTSWRGHCHWFLPRRYEFSKLFLFPFSICPHSF
jgi:hypothetical protein